MKRKLLLISNSVSFGKGYLDHCENEIIDFLQSVKNILFIPFASYDLDGYEKVVSERFKKMGFNIKSIHREKDFKKAVENAEALFIGGGNTFRLLNSLYKSNLIGIIKEKIMAGM